MNRVKVNPDIIRSDQGGEFVNTIFKSLLRNNGIRFWVTQNEKKANIAERALKTLKNKIYRWFSLTQQLVWFDILSDITESYNNTYHRSIGMTPAEVNPENEDDVWQRLQKFHDIPESHDFKFDINDKVRISVLRKAFEREYDIKWSVEFFIIADRYFRDDIAKYKLKDYANEEILGSFYEDELQKINVDEETVYRIENVIRYRNRRRQREALVKWVGWPAKFNSWIPMNELQDYRDRMAI